MTETNEAGLIARILMAEKDLFSRADPAIRAMVYLTLFSI